MKEARVTVQIPAGLSVNQAGKLCTLARRYQSSIELLCDGDSANAKSLLSVLGARIKYGKEIRIFCTGPDEAAALKALTNAFENGFGEGV